MLTIDVPSIVPDPVPDSRHPRAGRRGVAGAILLALTAGSLLTAAPAAVATELPTTAVANIMDATAEPVRIQAEDYTSSNGGSTKKETGADATGTPLGNVGGTWDGAEITFDQVELGTASLGSLTVRYVNNSSRVGANPNLEFYLDEKTDAGKLVTVPLPVTGSNWNAYSTTTVSLPAEVSGAHKLIVAMHVTPDANHPYAGNLDYFEFGPATLPDTFLSTTDIWKYSDSNTDPSGDGTLSWTTAGFDDMAWNESPGAFGAKNGGAGTIGANFPITTTLRHYIDGFAQPVVPTYHFRTDIALTDGQLEQVASLQGTITYDDAVRIYVNGQKVAGFVDGRVDAAPNQNLAYAGASGGDPVTSTFTIPAEALVAGENTIAVALYQDRESSSDIYLDLKSLVPVEKTGGPIVVNISDVVLGVGATEAQRNLTWYSDADVPQGAQLAKASDVVDGVFPDSAAVFATTKTGGTTSGQFFRDTTLTGLEENTPYAYRVGSDENGWSPAYIFRTQAFSGDFSFLFFGDPQVGASGNLAADERGWVDTVNVAAASYPDAELLFSAGDQVEGAPNENEYNAFLKPEQLRSIPLVATNGNHDVGSKAYEQHFNLPNEDLTAGAGSATASGGDYWFIYKDVLFLNINSNSRDNASHFAFMEKVIAEHGDEAKWKVLAFHHSIYSVAAHVNDGDILDRRSTLPGEISKLGFDVVLMGHDHNYTRSYLIKDGQLANSTELSGQNRVEAKAGEVLYLTANSSSGSKYYDTTAPDAWWASVKNQEKVRNYSVIEVTDGSFTLRTLRSQANGASKPVNSVVDEVVLTKDAAPELTVPASGDVAFGSAFDPFAGVSARDNVDGDLTAKVTVTGSIDTEALGAHTLTYAVTDARGNTSTVERIVTVVEATLATEVPIVSGPAKVGGVLTALPGTWTEGAKLAYRWLRDGVPIPGATGVSLKVTGPNAGHRISVEVTGSLSGYATASETSEATVPVVKGKQK
ncbi:immunoglobulin-like domain-containing protein [Agromyces subbeticus]|uniref:immunoglobulin-like domain-containing protein n=1 Tax=Agromyces subbeticus TaxID=293890 RepID=UPI0003B6DC18|nr:immunoglobulin-like domain-containing protein [Agromyces subbeticus]